MFTVPLQVDPATRDRRNILHDRVKLLIYNI